MKKTLITVAALFFVLINVSAQDFIYMRNQTDRVAAKNIKILTKETTYNLFADESGTDYSLNNKQISMIAYADGSIRFFEREEKITNRNNYKKNIIHYHLFDLVVNNFKLSYERIISKGKIGIQIPFAVGYSDNDRNSGFDDVRNSFYTGISVNFYPTGQGVVRYFMGPAIQVGTGYFEDSRYFEGEYIYDKTDTFIFRFLINNGIAFTPIDALSISLVGSLGIRYTDKTENNNNNNDDNHIKTVGAFSANLSYRF